MKKIVLLLFSLMFAGVFAFAGTGIDGDDSSPLIKIANGDGGDLFAPSELIDARTNKKIDYGSMLLVLKTSIDTKTLNGVISNKNANSKSHMDDYCLTAYGKKIEVGWQGYIDS